MKRDLDSRFGGMRDEGVRMVRWNSGVVSVMCWLEMDAAEDGGDGFVHLCSRVTEYGGDGRVLDKYETRDGVRTKSVRT